MVRGIAKKMTPHRMAQQLSSLPAVLFGLMSPKPTVEKVTSVK